MAKYSYDYPRPALTTDIIIFTYNKNNLLVLLIERKYTPFKGMWAFPGGFVDIEETAEQCAFRELKEETGLEIGDLSQLITVSTLGRDPRGRTVSVFFYGFVNYKSVTVKPGDDAKKTQWFPVNKMPPLAFDHSEIIHTALEKLLELIQLRSFGRELLPEYFILSDMEQLFNNVLLKKEISAIYINRYIEHGVIRKCEPASELYQFTD